MIPSLGVSRGMEKSLRRGRRTPRRV